MKKLVPLASAAAVLTLLAGCQSGGGTRSDAAPSLSKGAAETTCRNAVAAQLGGGMRAGDLRLMGMDTSPGETTVRLAVPTTGAPWVCVVDSSGAVSSVYYAGEG